MKIRTMLQDILRSLFHKPITESYPAQHQSTPEQLRGKLHWNPDNCTGCCLCVKDCPSNAIDLITIDKANKRFVMRYDAGRCTYCAQCVQNCRFNCLEMSSEDWELAATETTPFIVTYGREEDVQSIMDGFTATDDPADE